MFTGIVEELGTVKKIKKGANSAVFTIRAEKIPVNITLHLTLYKKIISYSDRE